MTIADRKQVDMEGYNPRVVIIDDESMLRETLVELVRSWGMEAHAFESPTHFLNDCPALFSCHAILLDIYFPGGNGIQELPRLRSRFPDAKVIMVTGAADKESAIQALKLGAFDYIEKPFETGILRHALHKALEARRKEDEVIRLLERLRDNERQLIEQNRRLEYLNEQLLKTNKAMAVLAQNMSLEREETERRIALQLRSILLPIVERMALDSRLAPKMKELEDALNRVIEDLASGQSMDARIVGSLSQTELRVATLIRSGLTTEEIARQLHVSVSTVKTHRRNIRKKLDLSDPKTDLKNYLESLAAGG